MTSSSALTLNHHSTGVIGVIGVIGIWFALREWEG